VESKKFVPLKSLKDGPADPAHALEEIRRIYFRTGRRTIEADLAHAIELLKSLPTEEEREKARVYMDGLAQMRGEFKPKKRPI
jgi:hypothetical protein